MRRKHTKKRCKYATAAQSERNSRSFEISDTVRIRGWSPTFPGASGVILSRHVSGTQSVFRVAIWRKDGRTLTTSVPMCDLELNDFREPRTAPHPSMHEYDRSVLVDDGRCRALPEIGTRP